VYANETPCANLKIYHIKRHSLHFRNLIWVYTTYLEIPFKEVRTMMLPEPFRFLRIGWWVVHIIGISLVFYLGYKFG